jgi:pyridoxal phosphate enzyme (YggS family)
MRQKLRASIDAVEARIAGACARAGRTRAEVMLVAVTKTVPAEMAQIVAELGILDLGENRPQELWSKAERLPGTIRWHLIGHLQRNKIERTLPIAHRIHAVDSVRLLQALEQAADGPVNVLLEVNASGEPSKQGFAPEDLPGIVPLLRGLQHVRVGGLMTMAALQDPQACRPTFATLRNLRDQLRLQIAPEHPCEDLSMGMSNDYEVAIEEGATMIRLGTALFT